MVTMRAEFSGWKLPMNSLPTHALARELLLPCGTFFVALPPPGRQSRGEGGHDGRAVAPARMLGYTPHGARARADCSASVSLAHGAVASGTLALLSRWAVRRGSPRTAATEQ